MDFIVLRKIDYGNKDILERAGLIEKINEFCCNYVRLKTFV